MILIAYISNDDIRFKGTFKNGVRQGRGEWRGSDGSRLVAEWDKGKLVQVYEKREGTNSSKADLAKEGSVSKEGSVATGDVQLPD